MARPLAFPWVIALLVASCGLVSAPLYFDPHHYFLTLGVGFCDADGTVHWWHAIVSHFVHGRGVDCGFPSTTVHLAINVSLFLLQGAFVERRLGSGRVALLTFTCLAVQIVLMAWLVGGRAHGASGMTWSYVPFVCDGLVLSFKRERWSMLKRPLTAVLTISVLFAVAGLAKHWHLWNLLVALPFYFAWRKTTDHGSRTANAAGITAALAVLFFNAFFVAGAVSGALQPASVQCDDLGAEGLPCTIDLTGRTEPAEVRFDVHVTCANGTHANASASHHAPAGARETITLRRSDFGSCDRVTSGGVGTIDVR
jgi:hypothetical protein